MSILKKEASLEIKNFLDNKDINYLDNKGFFIFKVGLLGTICRLSIPLTILTSSFTTYLHDAVFLTGLASTTFVCLFEMVNISDYNFKKKNSLANINDILFVLNKINLIDLDDKLKNRINLIAQEDIENRKLNYKFWKDLLNICKKYEHKILNIKIKEDEKKLDLEIKSVVKKIKI